MKTKRRRINIICSSDNYKESRKKYSQLRANYLQQFHNNNIEIIEKIRNEIVVEPHSISITTHKKAYVKCFGKLLPITIEDAERLSKTPDIIIIWQ